MSTARWTSWSAAQESPTGVLEQKTPLRSGPFRDACRCAAHLSQAVLPGMRAAARSSTSAASPDRSPVRPAAHHIVKSGLEALSLGLGPGGWFGVRVTVVDPTGVRTRSSRASSTRVDLRRRRSVPARSCVVATVRSTGEDARRGDQGRHRRARWCAIESKNPRPRYVVVRASGRSHRADARLATDRIQGTDHVGGHEALVGRQAAEGRGGEERDDRRQPQPAGRSYEGRARCGSPNVSRCTTSSTGLRVVGPWRPRGQPIGMMQIG